MKTLINLITKEIHGETGYHRFGGIEFRYKKKEIAHMHSNGLLDIYFPQRISGLLIDQCWCGRHHVYPASGWTSFYLKSDTDLNRCIQLIRWSMQLKTGIKTIVSVEGEIHQLKGMYEK